MEIWIEIKEKLLLLAYWVERMINRASVTFYTRQFCVNMKHGKQIWE